MMKTPYEGMAKPVRKQLKEPDEAEHITANIDVENKAG